MLTCHCAKLTIRNTNFVNIVNKKKEHFHNAHTKHIVKRWAHLATAAWCLQQQPEKDDKLYNI